MNESSSAVPSSDSINQHVNLSQESISQDAATASTLVALKQSPPPHNGYERGAALTVNEQDVLLELGIESKDISDPAVRLNTMRSKEATITWENMDVRYHAKRGLFASIGAMFQCNKNPTNFKQIVKNGESWAVP